MFEWSNSRLEVNGQQRDLTLTILGCGTLGTAILSGILTSLSSQRESTPSATPSGISTPCEELPEHLPRRFVACVTSSHSAKRIGKALSHLTNNLMILQNNNLAGVEEADVVLLGCKPQMVRDILLAPGIREALAGKLLISILAGVPVQQLEETLYPSPPLSAFPSFETPIPPEHRCKIVRAMPNTASRINESMTVIAKSTPPLPSHFDALVEWIFTRIGKVVHLSPSLMDVSTALCGSGPAFFSLFMEAVTDGAVAMGIPRKEAQFMAAQTMKGTAGLVLDGDHPALLRDKVCTPGGCTIGGLLVLEEGTVRGTAAKALREATEVASQLGRGVQGVNGTRFATRF